MSPGTKNLASIYPHCPSLKTIACGDYKSCNASRAFSAFISYHIPTVALRIRMVNITHGSTQGGTVCSSLWSSNWLTTNDTTAASNNILTNLSSNCSLIFSQIDSFSFLSSSFVPNFANLASTSAFVRPLILFF